MTVAAIFPDPEAALINHLKAALTATVKTSIPVDADGKAITLAADATHVQVELEAGDDNDYPVTERAQVRIACHAAPGKRTDVKELASLARAHAMALRSADVSGVFPRGGRSGVSTDPTTGNLMCWFLVRVDLKASLAS